MGLFSAQCHGSKLIVNLFDDGFGLRTGDDQVERIRFILTIDRHLIPRAQQFSKNPHFPRAFQAFAIDEQQHAPLRFAHEGKAAGGVAVEGLAV